MFGKRHICLLTSILLLTSCSSVSKTPPQPSAGSPQNTVEQATPSPEAAATAARPAPLTDTGTVLHRGVNLGNCLEAPSEGAWGVKAQEPWFKAIKDAGFDHVRLPIRWSAHAGMEAPYELDKEFLKRVDDIIGWALAQDLAVIIDVHHYAEYCANPDKERQRLYGIWENLAEHYKDMPQSVFFEPLNEPNGLADSCFNKDAAELIKIIRKTNPDRWIIIDGVHWSNVPNITSMKLPKDNRLIASVHLYEPMKFTHQGAEWMEGYDKYLGMKWEGTDAENRQIDDLLNIAESMGKKLGVPVYIGEFGAYGKADHESRVRWTGYVARQCEKRGMAWGYWEFCSGFGIYTSSTKKFDKGLLGALIPPMN